MVLMRNYFYYFVKVFQICGIFINSDLKDVFDNMCALNPESLLFINMHLMGKKTLVLWVQKVCVLYVLKKFEVARYSPCLP